MIYSLKIESVNSDLIEIGKNDEEKTFITAVNFKIDTVDDKVCQKSNAVLAHIEIQGVINQLIKEELVALFNWSKETDGSKWYRNIEIKVKTDEGTDHRVYNFENVFVVDYFEFYSVDGSGKSSHFELYLTQKENNLKLIDSY